MLRKNIFVLRFIAFVLLVSTVFTSCQSVSEMGTVAVQKKSYSGEELFKAVLFLEGEFVNEVPRLAELRKQAFAGQNEARLAQRQIISAKVVAHIQQTRPEFFAEFRNAMVSKNHVRVNQAIKSAKEALTAALSEMPEYSQIYKKSTEMAKGIDMKQFADANNNVNVEKLRQRVSEEASKDAAYTRSADQAIDVYLYWETAVAVAVVLVVILFAIDVCAAGLDTQDASLEQEVMVNQLTQALDNAQ